MYHSLVQVRRSSSKSYCQLGKPYTGLSIWSACLVLNPAFVRYLQLFYANVSPIEEFRDRLFQGYDDDWDSDFDDQPDPSSQMPPPAQPGAGGGGGMLSIPKNSNQSGSSGDVR